MMPLHETTNMQQFVNSRTSTVRPDKRPLTPQPNSGRERSLQRQDDTRRKPPSASHAKQNNEPVSREEAAKLKMDVPDTRPKSKLAQVTQGNATQRSAAPPHTTHTDRISGMDSRPSAFDDTQSIHYDDSMSVDDDRGVSMQLPFTYGQRRNSPRLRSAGPPIPSLPALYSETANAPGENEHGMEDHRGWMAEVDAERERRGIAPKYGARFNHNVYPMHPAEDDYDEGSEPDGDIDEGTFLIENTPSRTRVVADHTTTVKSRQEAVVKPVKPEKATNSSLPRHRKSLSDVDQKTNAEPFLRQQLVRDRFHVHKPPEQTAEIERSGTPQQQLHAPQPRSPQVQAAPFSSKVSSYHESSSEEEQPHAPPVPESPRPGAKRPRSVRDLDFDPEELRNKTMSELDNIPFPTDPRLPIASPAMDSNGQPLTLPVKLTNLTRMRPEDQATLFKSLADSEREQTAEWFLEKFRDNMVKLLEVRVERRKIALKFEMEVKRRERQVQMKKADVEEELAGLKKGGTELVRGKSPAK
ncbi:hypothetical protein PV04_05948 [Phialophora macrospora]|uniref:Extracellular mutant protein 11 C-terminal domain-containing protein n=1 Tax=Phialophora macrospora TaxID=1851006 RepID=A0A0D2FF23_9EURO|nr:hypothetical protein PV04_05948 [Phialophora macrospora]